MKKRSYSPLKSILATASVAALMLGSSTALGADKTANANPARTSTAGDWGGGVAPVANDNLILNGANNTVILDSAGFGINNFDINGANAGASLKVSSVGNFNLQLIKNSNGNQTLDISFVAAGQLLVTEIEAGAGAGLVNNVDFGGNDGALFLGGGKVAGYIDGNHGVAGDTKGYLLIGNGINPGDVTVTGPIGGVTQLNGVVIKDLGALTAGGAINSVTTLIAGTLNLQGNILTGKVEFTADVGSLTTTGAGHVVGNVITGTAGYGSYTLAGNNGFMAGNVGAADFPIGTFSVGANGNVSTAGKSVYAKNIVVQGGNTFTVTDGDILSATNITLNGDLRLLSPASSKITGVVIAGGGTLEFVDQPSATPWISTTSGFVGTIVLDSPGNVSQNLFTANGQISLGGNTTLVAGGNLSAATIVVGGMPVGLEIAANSSIRTNGAGIVVDISTIINDGVVLTLGDQTKIAGTIDGAWANEGTLAIAAGADVDLNGVVGGTAKLNQITVNAGAWLTTNENVTATSTNLAGGLDIPAGKVYNSIVSGPSTGVLIFLGDPSVAGTSTAAYTGAINFNGAGSVNKNLTTSGLTKLGANIDVVSGGSIGGGGIDVGAYTLTQNAGSVNGSIYSTGGKGSYNTSVPSALPTLGKSGYALASGSISGESFTYRGNMYVGNFVVNNNTAFDTSYAGLNQTGNIDYMSGSTVNLGSQTQIVNGTVTLGGTGDAVNINSTVTYDGKIGNIVGVGSKILAKGHNATVNLNIEGISDGTVLTLLTNADGMPNITNLADGVLKPSALVQFTPNYDTSTGNLTLTAVANKESATFAGNDLLNLIISESLNQTSIIQNIFVLQNGTNWTGDAAAFRNEVLGIFADSNSTFAQKQSAFQSFLLVAIINHVTQLKELHKKDMYTSIDDVSSRIGMNAGSEDGYVSGVWVKGVAGNANQKFYKGVSGYKATTLGATVGADTYLTDSLRVGIALSHSDGKIKMKDYKSGDRINSKSWLLSLYGTYNITDNIYTKAITTLGTSDVISNEKKLSKGVISESKGSYNFKSYALDAATGYRISLTDNSMLTPELGFTVLGSTNGGYTETGGAYNRTITTKGGVELLGKVGATLSTKLEYAHGVIKPAVYTKLTQYIAGKNPEVSTRLDGQTEAFSSKQKPTNKTLFHIGASAMATYGSMEYGASYDFAVAKKYTANTGSLKLRVNL